MQRHDAQLVRAATPPVAALTVAATALSAAVAGADAALGAALGGLLVISFFAVGHLISGLARQASGPGTMAIALGSYTVKIVLLGLFLVVFADTTLFDPQAFGFTALAAAILWLALQVREFGRLKIAYVELDEASGDRP
jgi:ATP synthase protein I